jgi:flagellar biosynthesis/type III secretory pathway M-ring protein FliF/YscJ
MAGFVEKWASWSGGLRISLIAGITLIAAFTIVAFWWLTSEEYHVLFSDLEPRDASRIVSALIDLEANRDTFMQIAFENQHVLAHKFLEMS